MTSTPAPWSLDAPCLRKELRYQCEWDTGCHTVPQVPNKRPHLFYRAHRLQGSTKLFTACTKYETRPSQTSMALWRHVSHPPLLLWAPRAEHVLGEQEGWPVLDFGWSAAKRIGTTIFGGPHGPTRSLKLYNWYLLRNEFTTGTAAATNKHTNKIHTISNYAQK